MFGWWAVSISGGSIFLTLVSIYLYVGSKAKRKETNRITVKRRLGLVGSFAFVWVLIGLLVFYIASIKIGSAIVFAAGNIFVELLLIAYLMKNRKKSE